MKPEFHEFQSDEDGAVTVDWVVLTAAIMGLGLAVLYPIAIGTESMAGNVADKFSEHEVPVFTGE